MDDDEAYERRLLRGELTLEDFRNMLCQAKKLGPLNKIMDMIPGLGGINQMMEQEDPERDIRHLGGIIDAMIPAERRNPSKVIDQRRCQRIAAGAAAEIDEVNSLVKQFDDMAAIMKEMAEMSVRDRMRWMRERDGKNNGDDYP